MSKLDGLLTGSNIVISLFLAYTKEELRRIPVLGGLAGVYERADEELWRHHLEELFTEQRTLTMQVFESVQQFQEVVSILTSSDLHGILVELARERLGADLSREIDSGQMDLALAAFRTRLARDVRPADYRGISDQDGSPDVTGIPLADVFVEPSFVPESLDPRAVSEQRRLLRAVGDIDADVRQEAERELLLLTSRRWQRSGRRVSLDQVLMNRSAVVLGDPGSGKTSLIRYLAGRTIGRDPELTPMRARLPRSPRTGAGAVIRPSSTTSTD